MRKKGKIHMSETVKSLANMYGLTLDEALAALEANNILILSTDLQLDQVKTLKYSKIFADIKSTPKPKPTPRPAPKPTPTQRTEDSQQHSTSDRTQHTGYHKQSETTKSVSRTGSRTSSRTSHQDADERQKQLLSRDYIIFTHMALRKPVAADIITEALGVKITRKTNTTLVVCAETVEFVMEAAKNRQQY